MVRDSLFFLTLASALGCGLVAGVFFAFSAFVMRALARLPPPHGLAAMQAINAAAPGPLFLAAFVGTGVACLALALAALTGWDAPGAPAQLAGSLLYLGGALLVTVACNLPRNDALAAADPETAAAAAEWARFVPAWTAWNSVRTVAALAASAALALALAAG